MSRLTLKLMSIPAALSLLALALPVSAQTVAPRLGIELLTSGLTTPLVASSTGATIGRLVLDTTGSTDAVRISSLPFILTTGNGALASTLTNCSVVNESSSSVNLSTPMGSTTGLVSGINTIGLTTPLILPAGTVTTLDLRCDPSSGLISGGTFSVSMNTANVAATGVSTGLPATVYVLGATPVTVPVTVPGVPNTGAGGSAALNWALLASSLGLVAVGAFYTKRVAGAKAK